AKCHNPPLEKWTNDRYYSFANLFARVRAKGWGGDPRSGDGRRTLYVESGGDLNPPRTGTPTPPHPTAHGKARPPRPAGCARAGSRGSARQAGVPRRVADFLRESLLYPR